MVSAAVVILLRVFSCTIGAVVHPICQQALAGVCSCFVVVQSRTESKTLALLRAARVCRSL